MESPPRPDTVRPAAPTDLATPIFDLARASRTSGGTIQGRALGNIFNNADADDITKSMLGPQISRVQVFTTHADPTMTMPHMVLKHEVSPRIGPVLKALGRKYSPVRSKTFILLSSL